ncbi:Tigger transposable element-derived protein [Trichinella pseudospiralis]
MLALYFFLTAILMQLWQCKSILFAVYLKEVQITCVLDQLEVDSRSLELHEMQIQWGKSFDECILMCNLLRPENKCNAIKYYQSPMKCFLLAVHINSTTTDAQQKSFSAIFIYGCSRGSYYLHEIKNYSTLVRGGTFISLQILNKTFIIERRPTADSIRSKIIGNHHKSCIADCIFTCHAMTGQSGCNAVIYNPKTRFCTLLEHETPTPPTTFSHHEVALMLLLHLTLPCDVKINSVVIKATHNMSYELISESRAAVDSEGVSGPSPEQPKRTSAKAFVHLYRYMEMPTFLSTMASNTERSNTRFVGNEQSLIELLNCYPDRQDERRNNPPPVRYYLKEIERQDCCRQCIEQCALLDAHENAITSAKKSCLYEKTDIDEALLQWFRGQKQIRTPINRPILKINAEQLIWYNG